MRRLRLTSRTPLVALLLFLAFALVLGGAHQGSRDDASALPIITPISPPISPTLTFPPLLIASDFSPADGETEVALNRNVTVRFNRDLKESTLAGNFYLAKESGVFDIVVPATISYSALLDTATLNPNADLVPNATYHVTLTNAIESLEGYNLFNNQTWSFQTISSPHVLATSPAAGALNVPLDAVVQVTFDKNMDWASVTGSSFYLQNNSGGIVPATLAKSVDKRTASLIPLVDLAEGQVYVATLTTAVRAENGLPLEATVVWSFTTVAAAPQVVGRVPAHGATGVPVSQVVSATFDKDMDPATLTSATFVIRKSGGSPLPATVVYIPSTKTATLDPATDLEAGATYEVTLTGAVRSAAGVVLAGAPVVWTFTTAGTAPTVTTKVPAAGATDVPIGQTISATFDKDMDPVTLTSATFYVQKSAGSPLPATVSYSAATRTATLDPMAALEAGATYMVTLSTAVQGADGQTLAGAPVVWSFTTAGGGAGSAFTDVPPGHPYYDAIYGMRDEHIIDGYQVGDTWEFRPGNTVLRAQFAKMICGVMRLTVTEEDWPNAGVPFTDLGADVLPGEGVVNSLYPHEYVAVAYLNQITKGQSATTFAPYVGIKRAQLVTMVVRAVQNLSPGTLATPPAGYPWTLGNFDAEHGPNMRIAEYNGLLEGLVGFGPGWNPWNPATRGETALVLWNLMGLLP